MNIAPGVRVTVIINDEFVRYVIVDKHVADPARGYISSESPIAQAVHNKQPGELVTIKLPSGKQVEMTIAHVTQLAPEVL